MRWYFFSCIGRTGGGSRDDWDDGDDDDDDDDADGVGSADSEPGLRFVRDDDCCAVAS